MNAEPLPQAPAAQTGVFGTTLLVAGCCIGASMIGLPVLSVFAGFFPSLLAIILAYAFTTGTGLLLLEATLWFDRSVNLASITQFALGSWGKALVGVLYLFLFYGIFVAYFDAGGQLFNSLLGAIFPQEPPREAGILMCLLCVGVLLSCTTLRGKDRINRLLVFGLVLTYALITAAGLPHVEAANLNYISWKPALSILPLLFILFGYQNLVPSIAVYLNKNVSKIRFSIIVGNFIPMIFYVLWNFVVLGMISDPANVSFQSGLVTEILQGRTQSPLLPLLFSGFTFCALVTSFLSIGISLVDFLRDGFQKRAPSQTTLYALALLPPLAISLCMPNLFLAMLSFVGGFVDVLLYGILPVCIVWIGRYRKQAQGPYRVAGGKFFLALMFAGSLIFLTLSAVLKLS